jgi:hypothetical protein
LGVRAAWATDELKRFMLALEALISVVEIAGRKGRVRIGYECGVKRKRRDRAAAAATTAPLARGCQSEAYLLISVPSRSPPRA